MASSQVVMTLMPRDDALLHVLVDVADEAEQRHNGHVRVALVEHFVRVVGDDHAGFQAQSGKVAHVLADHRGVDVDRAHDLRAVLVQVTKNVLAHLAAAVLNNLNLFHDVFPPVYEGTPFRGRAPYVHGIIINSSSCLRVK